MYSLAMTQVAAARDICLPAAGEPGRVEGAALASPWGPRPRPRPGIELLEQRPLRTAIWALSSPRRPLDWLLTNVPTWRNR